MSAMILLTLGNGCALHPDTSNARSAMSCNTEYNTQICSCVSGVQLQQTLDKISGFRAHFSFALWWHYEMTGDTTDVTLFYSNSCFCVME